MACLLRIGKSRRFLPDTHRYASSPAKFLFCSQEAISSGDENQSEVVRTSLPDPCLCHCNRSRKRVILSIAPLFNLGTKPFQKRLSAPFLKNSKIMLGLKH